MYEGRILGSNIGWMSSYTLEVLVVHLLIHYEHEIETPLDVFFKFFEIDLEDTVVTIFNICKLEDAQTHPELLSLEDYLSSLPNPEDELAVKLKMHHEILLEQQETFDSWNELYECNLNRNANTPLVYYLNIIDPINPSNNLGKSISHFNSKRILRVLQRQKEKLSGWAASK